MVASASRSHVKGVPLVEGKDERNAGAEGENERRNLRAEQGNADATRAHVNIAVRDPPWIQVRCSLLNESPEFFRSTNFKVQRWEACGAHPVLDRLFRSLSERGPLKDWAKLSSGPCSSDLPLSINRLQLTFPRTRAPSGTRNTRQRPIR